MCTDDAPSRVSYSTADGDERDVAWNCHWSPPSPFYVIDRFSVFAFASISPHLSCVYACIYMYYIPIYIRRKVAIGWAIRSARSDTRDSLVCHIAQSIAFVKKAREREREKIWSISLVLDSFLVIKPRELESNDSPRGSSFHQFQCLLVRARKKKCYLFFTPRKVEAGTFTRQYWRKLIAPLRPRKHT